MLLVSNTNIAVDTALERVAERLKDERLFDEGLVLRLGPAVKEELRHRFGPQVVLDDVIERLNRKRAQEKEQLEKELEDLKRRESAMKSVLRDFRELEETRHTLATREEERRRVESEIPSLEQRALRYQNRARELAAEIRKARTMGFFRRLLQGISLGQLERKREAAERKAEESMRRAQALRARLSQLDKELQRLRAAIEEQVARTADYPPLEQVKQRVEYIRMRLSKIRARLVEIERELKELRERLLQNCKVLATTVYRTYLGRGLLRMFDTMVVDEASMLMPPLVYYAAGLARSSVVVTGDFRQLPPIVMSEDPLAKEWLACDVFEKVGIPEHMVTKQDTPELVTLRTQYRMCEPICGVINTFFYPDCPLRTHPSVRSCPGDFPLAEAPLLFIDTTSFHPWAAFRTGSHSRYNLFHALLVRNIVCYLAQTGFLPPAGVPNDAVGVVTPYAAQARLIQALLRDRLKKQSAGVAATVHRFQGNEKRVILLDLTDAPGVPLSRFLRVTRLEETGARLFNVALSRARHHIVLVGNMDYLRRKAPTGGFVRRIIDYVEREGEPLELEALIPLAEHAWMDALQEPLPDGFELPEKVSGIFSDRTFYTAFARDLARARESVVIVSPEATVEGVGRWLELLRDALARRVRVQVIMTRPVVLDGSGHPGREAISMLQESGVRVEQRSAVSERLAIVDGRVLWHGTLQILAGDAGYMMRVESRSACQEVAKFLGFGVRRLVTGGRQKEPNVLPGMPCPEPGCDGILRLRTGRYGTFLGCSRYPACRYTADYKEKGGGR